MSLREVEKDLRQIKGIGDKRIEKIMAVIEKHLGGADRKGESDMNILLIACAVFYAVLCIFSIVTGAIYMSGKRRLNPLELSDSFMQKLSDPEKLHRFTVRMGLVTVIVGVVQGLTAYAIFSRRIYWLSLGFTLFSIASVGCKLKGKINAFPLIKLAAYLTILAILIAGAAKQIY